MPRIVIAIHVRPEIPPDWLKKLEEGYVQAINSARLDPYDFYHVDHIESGIIDGQEIQHK
jgi:hypothetical protein